MFSVFHIKLNMKSYTKYFKCYYVNKIKKKSKIENRNGKYGEKKGFWESDVECWTTAKLYPIKNSDRLLNDHF